jgi:dTDP-4-dehydrorhamnose reductase
MDDLATLDTHKLVVAKDAIVNMIEFYILATIQLAFLWTLPKTRWFHILVGGIPSWLEIERRFKQEIRTMKQIRAELS